MLGIEFLNRPKELQIDGLEFMDYQNGDLFKDLVKMFTPTLEEANGFWVWKRGEGNAAEDLEKIITYHTGINLELSAEQPPNAAVDAGFINPGNVLNIKNIEQFFSAKQSSLGETFKRLKTDVLRGWVDTSTGKIGGDFSKVRFTLYLNDIISSFLRHKVLKRYNITMAEALSAIIIHECGHVFTGFMHCYRSVVDPIVSTTAIKLIVDGKLYGKQRVEVVKEAFKIMNVGQQVKEEDIADFTGDEFVIYFNKATGTRDTRRTLSLGTQDRSSEIYADLYAVRMGCPKSLVAALASMPSVGRMSALMALQSMGAMMLALGACQPLLATFCGINAIFMTLIAFQSVLTPGDVYDSPYRRVKTILRDYIVQINNLKSLDSKAKAGMLAEAKEMEKICDDAKPFLEGTWVQRTVSYIASGSDFRAQDFEHFTDELVGHTLSLYKDAI
jgi:hypothetical protein